MRKFAGYVVVFVMGFLACALILRYSGLTLLPGDRAGKGADSIEEALKMPPRQTANISPTSAVAEAAARVEPAVVNIDIEGTRELRGPFGFLRGMPQVIQGSGSGIILSKDGYVVTNNHVIEPVAASRGRGISITLDTGTVYSDVRIVGRDPRSDIAVLKINNARDLKPAALGDSDGLRVGDWAIAVGNPLGFNSSVTLGIVSALNRRNFRVENGPLDRVIQTDAAINPGNSGGALADISGKVVGINTAIASSTGASVGIGFAIPINQARLIIDQLIKEGEVVRPYLGVVYSPLAQVDREGLPPGVTLPKDDIGVFIVPPQGDQPSIVPGSPADKAGLRPFDVIREVNGRKVDNVDVVKDEIQKLKVGDKVTMTVWRAGREMKITVTLEKMPEEFGA